ncbi:IclR family transcriptional regulator [Azospirillum sp. ST 5-10]|uniref:IclR family transcriptional regulator n=1 Tax=unclassified Azospirillum TaxID=2630922 RepID=UPI003F49CEA1
MNTPLSDKDISLTFAKGLEVVEAFGQGEPAMTIPDIARRTGINRTVARRLVLTLEHLGYLECRNRVYTLTPRVLRLAAGFLQGRQVGKAIVPILNGYSAKLGEAISFAMLDGHEAVYVAHSPGEPHMITLGFTMGTRLPLLPTGLGRALLAFAPPETRERLLAEAPLQPYTRTTKRSLEAVRRDLAETAERGYAYVEGEFEEGVSSLAVPVLRGGTELVGALGVVGPSPRFADEGARRLRVAALGDCAHAVAAAV